MATPAPSHQVPSPSSHPPPPPGQLCLRCHLQEARRPLFPDLLRRLWDESLNPSRVAGGGGWSRSMHPAPSSSQKTQGPGEGRGKTARPCLLAALSLPPAVPGSRGLTRAPRRRRGGLRAPGRVPVVTPARVCPIHPPRRPWTSDREPGPSSVRRVVPGHARGWGRVSAPTHRPPGSASRRGRGPGPEKEGRPTLTAGAPSGTGGLPSPLRAGVRVSLPRARLPPLAHTHTCTHTRADTQAHLHTRPAHRTGSQRPGPGEGADRRHRPLGCRGRIQRPPRAGPREGRGRGRRELCRSTSNPASGQKPTPEPRQGTRKAGARGDEGS